MRRTADEGGVGEIDVAIICGTGKLGRFRKRRLAFLGGRLRKEGRKEGREGGRTDRGQKDRQDRINCHKPLVNGVFHKGKRTYLRPVHTPTPP